MLHQDGKAIGSVVKAGNGDAADIPIPNVAVRVKLKEGDSQAETIVVPRPDEIVNLENFLL